MNLHDIPRPSPVSVPRLTTWQAAYLHDQPPTLEPLPLVGGVALLMDEIRAFAAWTRLFRPQQMERVVFGVTRAEMAALRSHLGYERTYAGYPGDGTITLYGVTVVPR